jgi:hypothetical protein
MLKLRIFSTALAVMLAVSGLTLGAAAPAEAGKNESLYKIGTYALGAGTVYALAKKKHTLALVGAAGTYFAYRKWKSASRDRRNGRRYYSRRSRR